MMTSRLTNEQIKKAEDIAGERLPDLLDALGITELRKAKRFYVGQCPIHGGDNNSAFNIFHQGNQTVGNWRCFTNGCHKHFFPSLTGFVRGYLSATKYGWSSPRDVEKECPFQEAVDFILRFIGKKDGNIQVDYEAVEKRRFVNHIDHIYCRQEPKTVLSIGKETLRNSIEIPAPYYIIRGYTEEILKRYDVGICTNPAKPMYMRSVVPIYDTDHNYVVGCTGRSVFDSCPLCKSYHNPIHKCPDEKQKWVYTKWKHNSGFKAEDYLYNYWFSKKSISQNGIAILTESPGNVWRLEEAGFDCSVATFGAHLTDGQRDILDKSGALALILLYDPDEAGREAEKYIKQTCEKLYSITIPNISNTDIGECSVSFLKERLTPVINKVKESLGL